LNRQDAKFAKEEEEREEEKNQELRISIFLFSVFLFFLLCELGVLAVQFFVFSLANCS
jgi:hypothetical protein